MKNALRVATHPDWDPESTSCSEDGFERRKGCRPGYGPEIIDFVMRYINVPYEIIKLPPSIYQGKIVAKNGTEDIFDGIMGDIQKGLYDTIAAPFTINSERFRSFDFTTPIFPMETMFVVGPHQPGLFESSLRLFTIFHPFLTATVLISLGVALIGLIVTNNLNISQHEIQRRSDFLNKLDTFIADASKQPLMTGKILILVFGTILVLFTKLYEGCLLTYLLLPPDPVRMSEKQLLERVYRKQLTFVIDEDEYNTFTSSRSRCCSIIVWWGGYCGTILSPAEYRQGHWNIIRFSTDEKYSKFQEALSANPPFFFDGELSTLVKIFEADPTKYVFFGDTDYADWLKGTDSGCKLRSIKMDNPMMFWAGFIFRKNSPWVKILNEGINRNLPFIYAVNRQYFKENTTYCTNFETQVVPLELLTMLGCFTLLLIGYSCSLLYLAFELFYKNKAKGGSLGMLIDWWGRARVAFVRKRAKCKDFGAIDFTRAEHFYSDKDWLRAKPRNSILIDR